MGIAEGSEVTVLDGGMGHFLRKKGVEIRGELGSWTRFMGVALACVEQRELVVEAHMDFIEAGSDVITLNNYGCVPNVMKLCPNLNPNHRCTSTSTSAGETEDELLCEEVGDLPSAINLLREHLIAAGECAKEAVHRMGSKGSKVKIAGSLPPLEASYRADLVQADETLRNDYRVIAESIAPYCDIFLCETMSLAREAVCACEAAIAESVKQALSGFKLKPVWVAYTVNEEGNLRSGERVEEATGKLFQSEIVKFFLNLPCSELAVMFNCSSPKAVSLALQDMQEVAPRNIKIGAFANGFAVAKNKQQVDEYALTPEEYAMYVEEYKKLGATIIGGCCGTFPEHIAAIAAHRN